MEKQILELRAIETNDNTLKIRPKATWEDALNDDIKIFINHKNYYNVGKSYNIDVTDRGIFLVVELDPLKEKVFMIM